MPDPTTEFFREQDQRGQEPLLFGNGPLRRHQKASQLLRTAQAAEQAVIDQSHAELEAATDYQLIAAIKCREPRRPRLTSTRSGGREGFHMPKGAAMSTTTGSGWQDGSDESGSDEIPNPETGVGIGATEGEPTTFEPEEPSDADDAS